MVNWPRSLSLNPNILVFLEILIPLATARAILTDEKLHWPAVYKYTEFFINIYFVFFN